MRYQVRCDAHAYENSSTDDLDQAMLWAYDLSVDYQTNAYVCYYNVKGHMQVVGEYTDGR